MVVERSLRKKSVVIKFGHLNPALQAIIGKPFSGTINPFLMEQKESKGTMTIKDSRKIRAFTETSNLASLLVTGISITKGKASGVGFLPFIAASALLRTKAARIVQEDHQRLIHSMKQNGILQTKFEGNYPQGWINPTIVANTHPAFFVKWNGDLIFPKMTRTEYARYQFQKRFFGKIGLNAWRWRAYLEPPQAPQPVMQWASEKAIEWATAIKRRPAFGMVHNRTRQKLPLRFLRQRKR